MTPFFDKFYEFAQTHPDTDNDVTSGLFKFIKSVNSDYENRFYHFYSHVISHNIISLSNILDVNTESFSLIELLDFHKKYVDSKILDDYYNLYAKRPHEFTKIVYNKYDKIEKFKLDYESNNFTSIPNKSGNLMRYILKNFYKINNTLSDSDFYKPEFHIAKYDFDLPTNTLSVKNTDIFAYSKKFASWFNKMNIAIPKMGHYNIIENVDKDNQIHHIYFNNEKYLFNNSDILLIYIDGKLDIMERTPDLMHKFPGNSGIFFDIPKNDFLKIKLTF